LRIWIFQRGFTSGLHGGELDTMRKVGLLCISPSKMPTQRDAQEDDHIQEHGTVAATPSVREVAVVTVCIHESSDWLCGEN
jgi:hypothetical protein